MAKKKQKISSSKMSTVFKKFWWLAAIVAIGIGWLLYSAVSSYMLQQRFASTYEQLDNAYTSLQGLLSTTATESDSTITKTCKKNWYGLASNIECGIYLTIYVGAENNKDIYDSLQTVLNKYNFRVIDLSPSSDKGSMEGVGSIISENGMLCGLYWGAEGKESSKQIIDLYCRETVPDFLPGYERQ